MVSSANALPHLTGASRCRAHIASSHSIIYTLSLLHLGMCSAFRRNRALMTCTIASSWRQRQHILVMSTRTSCTSSLSSLTTLCIRHAVCSLCSVLRSLYHWWQLQLLIIRIIAFLSGITFASTDDLLVELDGLVNSSLRTWRIVAGATWCLA